MIAVPERLGWWRATPDGAAWLDSLPALALAVARDWKLALREPFAGGNMSLTVRASCADGTEAVLKLNGPRERGEAEALALWDGDGAVRLLRSDPARRALLLERCDPGAPLAALPGAAEADRIAAVVLRRIWREPPPAHAFALLAAEVAREASALRRNWEALGRPFERELVDAVVSACAELGGAQGARVVLHGDFHGGNVLRAQREPWLAIDPQPLVGEREFDVGSLLRDRSSPSRSGIRARIGRLAEQLDLDPDRIRRWGLVNALAWGVSRDKLEREMLALARVLL